MVNREAVSTIRGYFYQFDYSIIQVLSLQNEDDTICVESIEDVDINNEENITLHQCKCYEETEYNHSVIAPAVRWMLEHFSKNKNENYNYYIYGTFKSGQQKLKIITVDFAKKHFFTYTKSKQKHIIHSELGLSDKNLSDFLSKLKINIIAENFEKQEQTVKELICSNLGCRKQESDLYYYNALYIIKKLATEKEKAKRNISRKDFVNQLKFVDSQFELWLLHKKGNFQFVKAIKKKYFNNGLNISPYDRFFLIECSTDTTIAELKTVVLHISCKYSKISQRAKPKFCPYFCFYGLNDEMLINLKKNLDRNGVLFTDGYDYRGADFNACSVVKEPTMGNLISLRIIDNIDLLDSVYRVTNSTIEIYQFYCRNVYYENTKFKHIKIPFERINDISEMV